LKIVLTLLRLPVGSGVNLPLVAVLQVVNHLPDDQFQVSRDGAFGGHFGGYFSN
jgi:hypothetical protein